MRRPALAEGSQRRRRAIMAVVAAAALVVAVLVVVLVVRPHAQRPVSAPVSTPAATAAPPTAFAVRDEHEVTFEELTVALPGKPFSCFDPLPTPPPGYDGYVSCSAVVHDDYDGVGGTWVSQVVIVLLDDSLGDPDDLPRSAKAAFRSCYRASFTADDSPTLSDEVGEPVSIHGPAGTAYRHRARVHVDREDLDTTYDLLSVSVVRLRSGRVAAFCTDLPDDAKGDLVRAAVTSQLSVTLH